MKDKLFPVERLAVSGNNRSLIKALLCTPKLQNYEPSQAFFNIICRKPSADIKRLILARPLNQESFETVVKMLLKERDKKSLQILIKKYDFYYLNTDLLESMLKTGDTDSLCIYYSRWYQIMCVNEEYYCHELDFLRKNNLTEELKKRYPKCEFSL